VSYRNYGENEGDLAYETVAAPENGESRLVVDAPRDRLVFSFPSGIPSTYIKEAPCSPFRSGRLWSG
jgi:hypothetical protein